MIPTKAGSIVCHQCGKHPRREHIQISQRTLGSKELHKLDFCSPECRDEFLYDERLSKEVEQKVREEMKEIYGRICSFCRQRIL
jgi:hypothetical protein